MAYVHPLSPPRERLTAYRTLHGLTIVALAKRIGASHTHTLRIEAGTRTPSFALALKIERETGIRVEDWPHLAPVVAAAEARERSAA